MKVTTLLFTFIFFIQMMQAQEEIILYPDGPIESNGFVEKEQFFREDFIVKISERRMYRYQAPVENNSGAAVLICPGGAYAGVSIVKEGKEIAQWFNSKGITAFVLYYRMPNGHHCIPLNDAQAAMELIYRRAKEWKVHRKKIGVMGFSAGGHLAATVGTLFNAKANRPAFMILGYPVITMQEGITHQDSRSNLLGKAPSDELLRRYSAELQVTKKTPPTFIFHAEDDSAVPIANSILFAKALQSNKVAVELYTFPKGGHGIGMRPTNVEADKWPERLENWMKERKLIQ